MEVIQKGDTICTVYWENYEDMGIEIAYNENHTEVLNFSFQKMKELNKILIFMVFNLLVKIRHLVYLWPYLFIHLSMFSSRKFHLYKNLCNK